MKDNPFLHASAAAAYIVIVAFIMRSLEGISIPEDTILAPISFLSLFVLSAATMGFLFFYQPVRLYFENRKNEAAAFFLQTLGYFAGFAALFLLAFVFSLQG